MMYLVMLRCDCGATKEVILHEDDVDRVTDHWFAQHRVQPRCRPSSTTTPWARIYRPSDTWATRALEKLDREFAVKGVRR